MSGGGFFALRVIREVPEFGVAPSAGSPLPQRVRRRREEGSSSDSSGTRPARGCKTRRFWAFEARKSEADDRGVVEEVGVPEGAGWPSSTATRPGWPLESGREIEEGVHRWRGGERWKGDAMYGQRMKDGAKAMMEEPERSVAGPSRANVELGTPRPASNGQA